MKKDCGNSWNFFMIDDVQNFLIPDETGESNLSSLFRCAPQ